MADRPAHDRHRQNGAAGHDQKREAEDARADAKAFLDDRNVDRLKSGTRAEQQEGYGDGDAGAKGESGAIV